MAEQNRTGRAIIEALINKARGEENSPEVVVQYAQLLLVGALRTLTDEVEGSLDVDVLPPGDLEKYKTRYSRLLDGLWALDKAAYPIQDEGEKQ